ncbi:MAG TPA: L-histidine N(alpha)-methyltransferase [Kofleriaceae bacterium]|nr:L-histidine N(alpha)-methyltransferase [Kofleriaceae bacterium]
MSKKSPAPTQLMELFLAVAGELGFVSDRDVGALADVGPENVANWRSGAVREFKNQKFRAAVDNLSSHLRALRIQAGQLDPTADGGCLHPLEIEEGSSPVDLQRQFRDRVGYDYLGHRFLYFDPQGALAWENLINAGYGQDRWLLGVEECADAWLSLAREPNGQVHGPIARAIGLGRRDRPRGIDIVSLGPGDGSKEVRILQRLLAAEKEARQRAAWITYAPVDVSIALLLAAGKSARRALLGETGADEAVSRSVLPFCADFEEGPLGFSRRLRTALPGATDGLRLVAILGNVFANLRDEEQFVRQKLARLIRPGDFLWIEIAIRPDNIESDPLYAMTRADHEETAAEANRRLLIEGPYRRWAAATGRASPNLDSRVWVREDDDSTRVPGSCNFCHDLIIKDERRVCTMLYSRRYNLELLCSWWEAQGYAVEGIQRIKDAKSRNLLAHLLLRRR